MIALQKLSITFNKCSKRFDVDLSVNPTRYNWNKYCTKANAACNCLILGTYRTAVYNTITEALFNRLYARKTPPLSKTVDGHHRFEFVSDDKHRFVIECDLNKYHECYNQKLTIDDVEYDFNEAFEKAIDLICLPENRSTPLWYYQSDDSLVDRFCKFLANTFKINDLITLFGSFCYLKGSDIGCLETNKLVVLSYYIKHFKSYATVLDNLCRLTNCNDIGGITGFAFKDDRALISRTDEIIGYVDSLDMIRHVPTIVDVTMITLFNVIRLARKRCECLIAVPTVLYDVCDRSVIEGIQKIWNNSDTQLIAFTNDYSKCSNVYYRPDCILLSERFNKMISLAEKCQYQIKQRDELTKLLIANKFS